MCRDGVVSAARWFSSPGRSRTLPHEARTGSWSNRPQTVSDGILVSQANGKDPAEITRDLIVAGGGETLFEPTVVVAPFVAKADIFRRQNGTWHVLEVKSSFSDTGKTKELVDDLAYTVMVFRRAGLCVAKASLLLLSRGYRFGDGPNRLFEVVDKTAEVLTRAAEFDSIADSQVKTFLHAATPPLAGGRASSHHLGGIA